MKRNLILIAFALIGLTANAQTLKTRSDGTFTQLDQRLAVTKNLSIPQGPVPTLNGGLNTAFQLFGNTTDRKLYIWNGTDWVPVSNDGVTASNGLTKIGNDIQLGGQLLTSTSITANDNAFRSLWVAMSNVAETRQGALQLKNNGSAFLTSVHETGECTVGLNSNSLYLDYRNPVAGLSTSLSLSPNDNYFKDDRLQKGLKYYANYAANNTGANYNPRWIPDLGYITSIIPNDANLVHKTGNETITGNKNFVEFGYTNQVNSTGISGYDSGGLGYSIMPGSIQAYKNSDNTAGVLYNDNISFIKGAFTLMLKTPPSATASRTYTLPDASGTIALTSNSATATLDFPSTALSSSSDLTITLTGAAVGDVIGLGVSNGSTLTNSLFTAWVSATNTVTVRFTNNDASAAKDPASGTFTVAVIK